MKGKLPGNHTLRNGFQVRHGNRGDRVTGKAELVVGEIGAVVGDAAAPVIGGGDGFRMEIVSVLG